MNSLDSFARDVSKAYHKADQNGIMVTQLAKLSAAELQEINNQIAFLQSKISKLEKQLQSLIQNA